MQRQVIHTDNAPKAIGPYVQAVSAGGFLYVSGQIPLDPATGEMVGGDDTGAQAERVMKNLGAILEAGGASFASVVKAQIFLTDLADFTTVNEVYGRYFEGGAVPARACVQVAALPKGAKVEIDAVAFIPGGAQPRP